MKSLNLVSFLLAGTVYCVSANADDINSSSPILFIGKNNGEILRCVDKNCDTFNTAPSSVTSLAVSGDYLFASLASGNLWRCGLQKSNDCKNFTTASGPIKSLAVSVGHVYAALDSGKIWRCDLKRSDSCSDFHTNETQAVTALAASDKYLYAGLSSGSGFVWAEDVEDYASLNIFNKPVTTLAANGKYVFVNLGPRFLGRCKVPGFFQCQIFYMANENVKSLSIFKKTLYVVTESQLFSCEADSWGLCSEYNKVTGVSSVTATHVPSSSI